MSTDLVPRDTDELEAIAELVESEVERPNPLTGEMVRVGSALDVVQALDAVRGDMRKLAEWRAFLILIVRYVSRRQGTKTLHVGGGLVATLSGGSKPVYDVDRLEELLTDAGLPAERLAELVETVTVKKVRANVAKQLRAASTEYAAILDQCERREPDSWSVSVSRGGKIV